MTVTMKELLIVIMIVMLVVVIAMVRNNICFLHTQLANIIVTELRG